MLTDTYAPLVGIMVGSTRAESFNRKLAAEVQRVAPGSWVPVAGIEHLPFFSEELEGSVPESVTALRATVTGLDALLIVTPEYNAGMPGMVKNAIDWLSRPRSDAALAGLPVAVIGASPSPGGAAGAIGEAHRVLRRAGADVVDTTIAVRHAHEALSGPVSLDIEAGILAVVSDLTEAAGRRKVAA